MKKNKTIETSQASADQKYAFLKRIIEDAGFFAPNIILESGKDMIVCTSKQKKGYGFTGRIVFVTERNGEWYLATPHPFQYRVGDPAQVAWVVIGFLGGDYAEKQESRDGGEPKAPLIQISYLEYEKAHAETTPDS